MKSLRAALLLLCATSCNQIAVARGERLALPRLSFSIDSSTTKQLAPGAAYHFLYSKSGPWAIHMLDLDRVQCWTPIAVKASDGAAGRERTSEIVRRYGEQQSVSRNVVGGVNADFFSLATGVPVTAYVGHSRVVTGPVERPVFLLDSARALKIATLSTQGEARIGADRYPIQAWNRVAPRGLAMYDDNFGIRTDTGAGRIEVRLAGGDRLTVESVDTTTAGVAISSKGHVLVAGPEAPAQLRERLMSLRTGDTLRASVALAPYHPLEAVGGFPVLVRDSAIAEELDRSGNESFRGRNPRTAVGISKNGRRFFLIAIDGRQQPYSDGMTLQELAKLMLELGATQALNLDGGGSTTLVYADPDSSGKYRVANHPSDRDGERPVGNALVVMKECVGR